MSSRALFSQDDNPRARLIQLGLTPETIQEAVLAGELHRQRCTRNHPPGYAGFGAWAETTCRLGELLRPAGWSRRDPSNLSLVVSPDETVAIVVATGDDRTGREGLPYPRTKYEKGPMVLDAIQRNVTQLELFDTGRRKTTGALPPLTWVLLVTRSRGEVRFELSLPSAVDEIGFIVAWRDRIHFAPLASAVPDREPLEQTDEIDIAIEPTEE